MKLLVQLQAFLFLVSKNSYKNTLLINTAKVSKINYDANCRTANPYSSHR